MIEETHIKIKRLVKEEFATGKHKYLFQAKDRVAFNIGMNEGTLDGYYYFKPKEMPWKISYNKGFEDGRKKVLEEVKELCKKEHIITIPYLLNRLEQLEGK